MLKDLPCRPGARRIREMVAQGEHQQQDFKYAISDARKIARSISAFANRDGGRLLIGVKDNGTIAGVRDEGDAYIVELAAERYCRPPVQVNFKAYSIDTDIRVIIAEIPPADTPPIEIDEGNESYRAYWRVADENIVAHPLLKAAWELRAKGTALILNQTHQAMLKLFDNTETPIDIRRFAIKLHIGEDTASKIITELAAADVLTFGYKAGNFTLSHHQK